MNAEGFIRKIDKLGRICLPIEFQIGRAHV